MPVRLRLIVTIEDIGALPSSDEEQSTTYSGVYVDVYRPKDPQGRASDVHGMTVIRPLPPRPWRGTLQGRRIYGLTLVHHTMHVVPVDERAGSTNEDMYINNTADWTTYNHLYNDDWEVQAVEEARVHKDNNLQTLAARVAELRAAAKERRKADKAKAATKLKAKRAKERAEAETTAAVAARTEAQQQTRKRRRQEVAVMV